ncbi:TetR family transcriptional regulator [Chloroflexia bacterium SDU3-3]|nr:TetR family transcriptional regulator [Chloroflexia bacterium SDU3-3]
MPKKSAEAHRKLQQAALELFRERGYEQTTAAEIAAQAGVTERTFFRHFADKRDILFDREVSVQAALAEAIASAPADLTPMQVLLLAFHGMEAIYEDNRSFSAPRQAIIAATPALRERELTKMAAMIAVLASALEQRGVDPKLSTLAAQVGTAAFTYALMEWLDDTSSGLGAHLDRAFNQLVLLSSGFREQWHETSG